MPSAEVTVFPVADGGEGTLDALMWAHGRDRFELSLAAADHTTPVTATYGILERDEHRMAVLESAQTTGISQVAVNPHLPQKASSLGFGTMLTDALDQGVNEVLVTLGGSATTDGGTGVFQALGATLYDRAGTPIRADTNPLWHFDAADFSGMRDLGDVKITILNDVTNPMTGPEGAAATFGLQKGATPQQVEYLDAQQKKWVAALEEHYGMEIDQVPGAGAAGGLGGAYLALGGRMQPGFARVAEELGIADAIKTADLVLTGEGSLDWQSAYGKVPAGVGALAKQFGTLVVGLAGRVSYPLGRTEELLDAVFPIHSRPMDLAEALKPEVAAQAIRNTAQQVTRLVLAAGR